MKNIREDIKNRSFRKVYLLYGEEAYLIRMYRDKLVEAVTEDDSTGMNCNFYKGDSYKLNELEDIALTMPCFAERRCIVLEDGGLFGADNGFAEFLSQIPDTTVLILVEGKADKRTKLYKEIKQIGYVCEFAPLSPEDTVQFIVSRLGSANKRIRRDTCDFILNNVGGDLYNIATELEKLIAYTGTRAEVTVEDVLAVCVLQTENRIFDIVDAVERGDRKTALRFYFDLIAMKESPLRILRVMTKEYMRLLMIFDCIKKDFSNAEIVNSTHMQEWLIKKYREKLKRSTRKHLTAAVEACTFTEEQIKTGNISDEIGCELLLEELCASRG